MSARAYKVVEMFEEALCEYTGAPYAVAVESCTFALMLCCKYLNVVNVQVPLRTYASAAMAVINAGGTVLFRDYLWTGAYRLSPYPVWDAAKRFRKGMFVETIADGSEPSRFHYVCPSFHQLKICGIGRGGAILTDDAEGAKWFRRMRYDGREGLPYKVENITLIGFNGYMTPDQAAKGLMIMDGLPDYNEDQREEYPPLTGFQAFSSGAVASKPVSIAEGI